MTIFCDMNMIHYDSQKMDYAKKNDNVQKNVNVLESDSIPAQLKLYIIEEIKRQAANAKLGSPPKADAMGDDYNKDGNMAEYATRMAQEAAKKNLANKPATVNVVDGSMGDDYNKDGNMAEYATRMAKEAEEKKKKMAAEEAERKRNQEERYPVPMLFRMRSDAEMPAQAPRAVAYPDYGVRYYNPMHYHYYPYHPSYPMNQPLPY